MIVKRIPEDLELNQGEKVLDIEGNKFAYFSRYSEIHNSQVNITRHCILYVLSGEKILHGESGKVHLRKGDLAFLRSGLYLNSEKILEEGSFDSITFFLNAELLDNFVKKHRDELMFVNEQTETPSMFLIENSERVQTYFHSLKPYFFDQKKNDDLLQLKFEELLLNLITHNEFQIFRNFISQLHSKRQISLEEFMLQHFDKNISISEIAFLKGMSVSSFKREFKKTFEDSPARWMKTKRLEKAKFLIESDDLPIGEVAEQCGFESISYFIASFKEMFGSTPFNWRKQKQA